MEAAKKHVYHHKSNSREYLYSLIEFSSYCKLIENVNRPEASLLRWIVNFDRIRTEETLIPDIKTVAKEIGIPYGHVSKYLHDIYYEIHELNANEPRKFLNKDETICCVDFNYIGAFASFNIGFTHIPRVGDQIRFGFIKPKIGSDRFWVKDILHEKIDGLHLITLNLTYEEPNAYLQLLKEKAYLNRELDWMEYRTELSLAEKDRLIKNNRSL
jgi:hypothetical protein